MADSNIRRRRVGYILLNPDIPVLIKKVTNKQTINQLEFLELGL